MSRRALERDEHHGFGRPQRRTKPRTKDRPDYSDAEVGLVITVDRGRYSVDLDNEHGHRRVLAAKARQLGRKGVIVGDRARVVGDTSGAEGTLARIVEVTERETVLRRTADDNDPFERPIVANADQLAIVTALADPPPRMGMIDRILVASYDAGLSRCWSSPRPTWLRRTSCWPRTPASTWRPSSSSPAPTSPACARCWPATAPSSSGTPESASPRSSTP